MLSFIILNKKCQIVETWQSFGLGVQHSPGAAVLDSERGTVHHCERAGLFIGLSFVGLQSKQWRPTKRSLKGTNTKKTVLPELRIPPSGLQHGQRAAVQHRQRTGDFLISITGVSNWDNSSQQHFISSRNSTNKHFQVCNTVQEQKCETQYMEKYEEQCSTVNEQVHSLYLFSSSSPSLTGFLPETVWTKIILLGVQHCERASVQHCERAGMFLLLINHPYFPHRLCP